MRVNTPKGTRDFTPEQVNKRQFIFDVLQKVFRRYGFQPLETPAIEHLETLTGKYGDEGDQLLFKVLNNGDYLSKADEEALNQRDSEALLPSIAKRGLRYDLTVPFARYVVQHQNDIAFPFKRYQIQPVWRGDRPQKGRYQEFYQCDVDVIGSSSLLYEAELVQIYDTVFAELGLKVVIRMNNRKILDGLAHYCGHPEELVPITVAIDKLDKIGWEGVQKELAQIGLSDTAQAKVKEILDHAELEDLAQCFEGIPIGQQGIEEMQQVQTFLNSYQLHNQLHIDFTLARGLSYYTGCIFEVVVDTDVEKQAAIQMGSIGGGGRYANLTDVFGLPNMSGVGISFGAARIYDVMEELDLFRDNVQKDIELLFLSFDKESLHYSFDIAQRMRQANIPVDIYPKAGKFKKQMKYANARDVDWVAIVGESERQAGTVALKNMRSGEQEQVKIEALIQRFQAD